MFSTVLAEEASSWKFVPRGSGSLEEAIRMELHFLSMEFEWNKVGSPPMYIAFPPCRSTFSSGQKFEGKSILIPA